MKLQINLYRPTVSQVAAASMFLVIYFLPDA